MRQFPRSDKQIAKSKADQAARLGQKGAYGKRKRCFKGKSCGASCIANYKVCLVDLTWVGQNAMTAMRDRLIEIGRPTVPGINKLPPPVMPIFKVEGGKVPPPAKFKFSESILRGD